MQLTIKNVENSKMIFMYGCWAIAQFICLRSFDDFNHGENMNVDKSFIRFALENEDDGKTFKFDEFGVDSVLTPLEGCG